MKRALVFFLVLLITLSAKSKGSDLLGERNAQIEYQVSLSESDIIFDRKNDFDVVSLKGGIRAKDYGCPDLPVKLIHLILPNNQKIAEVSVIKEQHIVLDGEYLILPGQPDEKTDGSFEGNWVSPNPQVYNSDSLYPHKLVKVVDEGYLAGNHLVTLAFNPLRYMPQSRRLLFYNQLNIGVELEPSEGVCLSSQVQRRSSKAQRLHELILQQFVDNKIDIPNFICGNSRSGLFKTSDEGSVYPPYVVITSSELKAAFLPLVEWKTKKGMGATIVCMDSIITVFPGRDDAEKLRNFLTEAYQNGTSWVLLGGDEDVVPIRYAYPTNTSTSPSNTDQQICDLYFSDVDGEWDVDDDGIWGEPQHDNPDIYPDLFVGRVPASDTAEVRSFVEKLLAYERNPGDGSADYLTRGLWMSSDQMRDWEGGTGQHNLVSEYIPSSFYQDLTNLVESPSGDAQNPVGPDGNTCVGTMDQGWGIVGILAHGKANGFVAKSNLTNGTPKSWVLTTEGKDDGHGHLPNLGSDQKYGIAYSISCSQSAIDVDKYPYLGGEPSVGEYYPLASQKGGVAFLGYTRWGWVSISYLLFERFLEYLFDDGLGHHIGVAEALSRCAYPSYRDIDYGHNLFGDPEMPVWTDIPSDLTVVHPDEVTMGDQTINLSVSSQGAGVDGAQVCLTLRGSTLFLGETDQNGDLSCMVNLDDVGEMSLVVTKSNFIPYEDSVTVSLAANVDEDNDDFGIQSFELFQNYPNPFNPVTNIRFQVGNSRTPAYARLNIYNILGQKVKTLVDEPKKAGSYQVVWDGTDDAAEDVSSGIYFYRLQVGDYIETRKMTLMR